MTNNQLRYVISVAENGSFSGAAKKLFLTQPSLSNQIKALEEELGTPIFIRKHHELKLTEAGHDLVLYSKRILNELDHLQSLMQFYSSYSRGSLTIGAFTNAGYLGIFQMVMDFQKLYPKIDIRLVMDRSSRLVELLMTQEIDVAFLSASESVLRSGDLQYAQLDEEPFVAVVPRDHPLHDRSAIESAALKNEKVILPTDDLYAHSLLLSALSHDGEPPLLCGECSSTESCIQMVESGFGISIVTAFVARQLKNDHFHILPLIPTIRLKLYLAMLKTSYPGSISDEFFGFLQTRFR